MSWKKALLFSDVLCLGTSFSWIVGRRLWNKLLTFTLWFVSFWIYNVLFLFKVLVSFMLDTVTVQGSANMCCDPTPRLDQLPRMSLTFLGVQMSEFSSFPLTQNQDMTIWVCPRSTIQEVQSYYAMPSHSRWGGLTPMKRWSSGSVGPVIQLLGSHLRGLCYWECQKGLESRGNINWALVCGFLQCLRHCKKLKNEA